MRYERCVVGRVGSRASPLFITEGADERRRKQEIYLAPSKQKKVAMKNKKSHECCYDHLDRLINFLCGVYTTARGVESWGKEFARNWRMSAAKNLENAFLCEDIADFRFLVFWAAKRSADRVILSSDDFPCLKMAIREYAGLRQKFLWNIGRVKLRSIERALRDLGEVTDSESALNGSAAWEQRKAVLKQLEFTWKQRKSALRQLESTWKQTLQEMRFEKISGDCDGEYFCVRRIAARKGV